MNVLSLFDGMSCGRIALDRAEIAVSQYYASEIDKYAIKVSDANYPNIIRLGDVRSIKTSDLPQINLLMAGSPCQGFSYAGKQLAFKHPQSALFFEFLRIFKEIKPKFFLLENVKMRAEFQNIISGHLGVNPLEIDSSLVSCQIRKRLYWTNIPNLTPIKDKGILLKDILEHSKIDLQEPQCFSVNDNKRVKQITENWRGYRPHRGDAKSTGISELGRIMKPNGKTDTLTASHAPKIALNNNIKNLIYRKLSPLNVSDYKLFLIITQTMSQIVRDIKCLAMDGLLM